MHVLQLTAILPFLLSVRSHESLSDNLLDDYDDMPEPMIEREDYKHVFGIEPFLRAHVDDPFALFSLFYDDKMDEYENITFPKKTGDSIVRVRKPSLRLHPKVQRELVAFLRRKNIPELNHYIDKHHLDAEEDNEI